MRRRVIENLDHASHNFFVPGTTTFRQRMPPSVVRRSDEFGSYWFSVSQPSVAVANCTDPPTVTPFDCNTVVLASVNHDDPALSVARISLPEKRRHVVGDTM